MYFDSYITGKRIQQLRKTKGLTQEQFAVKLNISDRHLGKIERGEGTASIDLLVEVAISLNTTLDFLILGVLDTPRERELNAQIKKHRRGYHPHHRSYACEGTDHRGRPLDDRLHRHRARRGLL